MDQVNVRRLIVFAVKHVSPLRISWTIKWLCSFPVLRVLQLNKISHASPAPQGLNISSQYIQLLRWTGCLHGQWLFYAFQRTLLIKALAFVTNPTPTNRCGTIRWHGHVSAVPNSGQHCIILRSPHELPISCKIMLCYGLFVVHNVHVPCPELLGTTQGLDRPVVQSEARYPQVPYIVSHCQGHPIKNTCKLAPPGLKRNGILTWIVVLGSIVVLPKGLTSRGICSGRQLGSLPPCRSRVVRVSSHPQHVWIWRSSGICVSLAPWELKGIHWMMNTNKASGSWFVGTMTVVRENICTGC